MTPPVPHSLLLPIDIARCPLGVFDLVNRFGGGSKVSVTLLHVVTLNLVSAENRVYEELAREAEAHLRQLASSYLHPPLTVSAQVRFGQVAKEIIAQAKAEQTDVIFLPVFPGATQKRSLLPWRAASKGTVTGLAQRLIRAAPCDVVVAPMHAHFDCTKHSKPLMTSPNPHFSQLEQGLRSLDPWSIGKPVKPSCSHCRRPDLRV